MIHTLDSVKNVSSKEKRQLIKRFIFSTIKNHKWYITSMFFTILLIQAYSVAIPQLSIYLIDNSAISHSKFNSILISVLIYILSFVVVRGILTFVSRYHFYVFEQKVEFDLKEKIYQKILNLKVVEFDTNNEGYFMSRLNNDSLSMAEMAHLIPRNIMEGFSSISISIVFIFMISWMAGLYTLLILILSLSVSISQTKPFYNNLDLLKSTQDKSSKFVTNDIIGIRDIKNYVARDEVSKKTLQSFKTIKKYKFREYVLTARWIGTNTFLMTTTILANALIGTYLYNKGLITIGQVSALMMYSVAVRTPMNAFVAAYETYFKSSVSAVKYYKFIEQIQENNKTTDINLETGTIELKNINLSFGKKHIIKNLNLKINHGEHVALVGETGSGKTTLFKLLMKYYLPQSGEIILGGKNVDDYSTYSVRDYISYMAQDPFISFDTIKTNISLGTRNFNEETYTYAIEASDSKKFINKLPDGDNTMIGPKGITLSGGQRQRLALARIFMRQTPILLFDEATSSLDNATEKKIKDEITIFSKNKTTVTIAHRLSSIRDADRIIVLHNGEIVEDGSWSDLESSKGYFYRYLHSMQGGNNE